VTLPMQNWSLRRAQAAKQIAAKRAQAAELSAELSRRYGLEHALTVLGIPFDPDKAIRLSITRRHPDAGGQIVALRVNGTDHRLADPLSTAQWTTLTTGDKS